MATTTFMTTETCTELSKSSCLVKHVLYNAVLYTRLITKTHKRCLLAIFMLSALPTVVLHQRRSASCDRLTLLYNHRSTGNCTVNFWTPCIIINFVTILLRQQYVDINADQSFKINEIWLNQWSRFTLEKFIFVNYSKISRFCIIRRLITELSSLLLFVIHKASFWIKQLMMRIC
jgi:hypothetical protein